MLFPVPILLRLTFTLVFFTVMNLPLAAQDIETAWMQERWFEDSELCLLQEVDGRIFAANNTHGLLYSDDSGDSWIKADGLENFNCSELVKLADFLFTSGGAQIYRSNDGGASWVKMTDPMPEAGTAILGLTAASYDLYAADHQNVYRSNDFGFSWTILAEDFSGSRLIAVWHHGRSFFVLQENSLVRLDTEDSSLLEIELPFERAQMFNRLAQFLFVGGITSGGEHVLYRFESQDRSWHNSTGNLPTDSPTNAVGQARRVVPEIFAANDRGIYSKTFDWTWEWNQIYTRSADQFANLNSTLFVHSAQYGLARMNVDESEEYLTPIQRNINSWSPGRIFSAGENIIVSSPKFLTKEVKKNVAWAELQVAGDQTTVVNDLLEFDDEFLLGGDDLYHSRDGGASWQLRHPDQNIGSVLHLVQLGTDILAYGNDKVSRIGPDNSLEQFDHDGSRRILSMAAQGDHILAATEDEGMLRSNDGGRNWESLNSGLNGGRFDIVWANDEFALCGSADGVFMSQDGGDSWSDVTHGDEQLRSIIRGIVELDGFVYIANRNGLWYSKSPGQSWTALGLRGLPHDVRPAGLALNNRRLMLSTEDSGVFTTTLTDYLTTDVKEHIVSIATVQLAPNPASRSIRLTFELEQPRLLGCRIFDLRGTEVLNIPPAPYAAGSVRLDVNTSMLAAGTYICVLNTGDSNLTRQFQVIH